MVRGMPANILNADVMFPSFRDDETSEQKLDKVTNYLYMLLEQLRYSLSNLDADNFNDTGLREIAEGISRPLQTEFENELVKTAALIEGFSNEFGSQIAALTQWKSGAEQSIASVTQKANANGASITSLVNWQNTANSTLASVQQKANANGASITSLVNWQNTANSEIGGLKSTTASIKATADSAGAKISQVVEAIGDKGEVSFASIAAGVSNDDSFIKLIADKVHIISDMLVLDSDVFIAGKNSADETMVKISGNNISLNAYADDFATINFWWNGIEEDNLLGQISVRRDSDLADDRRYHVGFKTLMRSEDYATALNLIANGEMYLESNTRLALYGKYGVRVYASRNINSIKNSGLGPGENDDRGGDCYVFASDGIYWVDSEGEAFLVAAASVQ